MIRSSAVFMPSIPVRPVWPADRALLSDEEWQALLWPLDELPPSRAVPDVCVDACAPSAEGSAS
ncbi:hypothetical protein [Limnohabitans sp.]|jgi:hypothetical protein|uniref:hypothetical protein n=1 Tax=Limnohabitans sp. TaxID=1907725 RepID=UPI0035B43B43